MAAVVTVSQIVGQFPGGSSALRLASVLVSVEVDSCERGNIPRLQRHQISKMVRQSLVKSLRPRGRACGRRRITRKGKGCKLRRQLTRNARTQALVMALQRVWRSRCEARRQVKTGRMGRSLHAETDGRERAPAAATAAATGAARATAVAAAHLLTT